MGCAGLNEVADRASAVIRHGILKGKFRIIGQFLQGICRETAVEVSGHDRECAGSVLVQNAPQHFCLLCAHMRNQMVEMGICEQEVRSGFVILQLCQCDDARKHRTRKLTAGDFRRIGEPECLPADEAEARLAVQHTAALICRADALPALSVEGVGVGHAGQLVNHVIRQFLHADEIGIVKRDHRVNGTDSCVKRGGPQAVLDIQCHHVQFCHGVFLRMHYN